MTARLSGQRGSALVEFSVTAFLLLMLLFAVIDFGRLMLIYATMADAARAGVRYASVHGSARDSISGVDGASGPGSNPTEVVNVVKNNASAGFLQRSLLTVTVTYPSGTNSIGSPVRVQVSYPYNPFSSYFPLNWTVGSTSQGIIAF